MMNSKFEIQTMALESHCHNLRPLKQSHSRALAGIEQPGYDRPQFIGQFIMKILLSFFLGFSSLQTVDPVTEHSGRSPKFNCDLFQQHLALASIDAQRLGDIQ